MPVIKSAKKKQRADKKRTSQNKEIKTLLQSLLKKALKNPTEKEVQKAVKAADKAAKKGIIHKNKAARIKKRLARLTAKKAPKASPKKK